MSAARRKRRLARMQQKAVLNGVDDSRGWLTVFESRPGAWQADIAVDQTAVLANWVVWSCMTLIAGDVGKMPLKLVSQGADGIWREQRSPAFTPVLTKPNGYQTRQKFFESWMYSKLGQGNAYILKERDARSVVIKLHVLDPQRVRPLVSDSGEVFYQLNDDILAGVSEDVPAAPASEIIHDRGPCLFHPLVGLSPIFASGLAATQGLKIQGNSSKFFENMSRPSGILLAPGKVSDETAKRLKETWEKNFRGDNMGRMAVLGDNMKYEPMSVTPVDSQLVEQLKITSEMVCSTFHVPGYKVGVGAMPTYQNAQVLNQIYYSDCLQAHIEAIESLLDEGLGLIAAGYGSEFDLDALLRMDSKTQIETLKEAVGSGVMAPNEARRRLNYEPVDGGDTPYLQQQNYSLAALDKRDTSDDPFGTAKQDLQPTPAAPADEMKHVERFEALQAELRDMRERAEESERRRIAAEDRRSSQLAELLADVHREIDSVKEAHESVEKRTADEVAAVQRIAALDLFAKELECQTMPNTTH